MTALVEHFFLTKFYPCSIIVDLRSSRARQATLIAHLELEKFG